MKNAANPSTKRNWTRRGMLALATTLGVAGLTWSAAGAAPAALAAPRSAPDPLGLPEMPGSLQGLRAWSRPSAEHKASFASPGVVTNILVKDGDAVKKDQEIAIQSEAEEKAKLEIAEYEAGKAADQYIIAAQASLDKAKVDVVRNEQLYAAIIAAGRSNTEIEQARVELKVAEATLELRKNEKVVKQKQAELQKTKLAEKRLKSPADGFVLRVEVREGEGADLSKPAIQIVRNDPLWVEVDVPTGRARALKMGQTLEARYTDEEPWRQGKVIYMAPYADPRSNTRRFRLEMPNPEKREAGVQMVVRLPDNVAVDKTRTQADVRPALDPAR